MPAPCTQVDGLACCRVRVAAKCSAPGAYARARHAPVTSTRGLLLEKAAPISPGYDPAWGSPLPPGLPLPPASDGAVDTERRQLAATLAVAPWARATAASMTKGGRKAAAKAGQCRVARVGAGRWKASAAAVNCVGGECLLR